MPDYTFTEFPIDADEIDIDQLQQDVQNVTDDILTINQAIESINQRITALTNRTINGYDLSEDRTLFVQDIPSKNLLPNSATTRTLNGVTFTVNSDGSISTSGTASSETQFTIGSLTLKSGIQYAFNGCPSGGDLSSYFINFSGVVNDIGDGATIAPASDVTTNAVINIVSGTNVNGKTFRPMIRPASVEDDTYVPYAKTNVELTEYLLTDPTTVAGDYGNFVFYRFGRIVICQWSTIDTITLSAWGSVNLCEIPTEFRPATYAYYFLPRQSETTFIPVYIAATNANKYLRLFNQSGQAQTTGKIINGLCMWINKAT